MAVSIVNWGKQLISFSGNCHHKKNSSYLSLGIMCLFVSDAQLTPHRSKPTHAGFCPTHVTYSKGWMLWDEMSSSGVVRAVSHSKASYYKCQVWHLKLYHLCTFRWKIESCVLSRGFFFWSPSCRSSSFTKHTPARSVPFCSHAAVQSTQQLTVCNSVSTNVSHFPAHYCISMQQTVPQRPATVEWEQESWNRQGSTSTIMRRDISHALTVALCDTAVSQEIEEIAWLTPNSSASQNYSMLFLHGLLISSSGGRLVKSKPFFTPFQLLIFHQARPEMSCLMQWEWDWGCWRMCASYLISIPTCTI